MLLVCCGLPGRIGRGGSGPQSGAIGRPVPAHCLGRTIHLLAWRLPRNIKQSFPAGAPWQRGSCGRRLCRSAKESLESPKVGSQKASTPLSQKVFSLKKSFPCYLPLLCPNILFVLPILLHTLESLDSLCNLANLSRIKVHHDIAKLQHPFFP